MKMKVLFGALISALFRRFEFPSKNLSFQRYPRCTKVAFVQPSTSPAA